MKVGWVLVARPPKNAFFFEKFYRGHHLPNPRLSPYTPPVTHSPQRTRADCGTQAAGQTVPDARQTVHNKPRTDTHAQTLDTLHRSAPDTRQAAPGRSYRRQALEGVERVRQTTLFRIQNIFHANVYKCCLCNLTFPWIHV